MESDKEYKAVQISFQLSADANKRISISASRSGRKKVQEAKLRLEDHLLKYSSISKIGCAIDESEN